MNKSKQFILLILIVFSFLIFFSSISQSLFVWFYPDEILGVMFYDDVGVFGCIKKYYETTTINRLSASYMICSIGWLISNLSPFWGVLVGRFLLYFMVPISIYYLLVSPHKINKILTLSIAFLISSFIFFMLPYTPIKGTGTSSLMDIQGGGVLMWGLDLAIYATATVTFFLMIALFKLSLQNNYFYILFCLLFAINLNSHEVFLVISGFFVPLYYWYTYKNNIICDNIIDNYSLLKLFNIIQKNAKLLVLIFIISSIVNLMAPGLEFRQKIWPTTGSVYDGIFYILLSHIEIFYRLYVIWPLIIITFFVGVLSKNI